MKTIEFNINKLQVYNEVAKTTSYIGSKMMTDKDQEAYDRIFAGDADRLMLERFWTDAANRLTGEMRLFAIQVSKSPASNGLKLNDNYQLKVEVSDDYKTEVTDSVENGMFNYMVESITGSWLALQNGEGAAVHSAQATILLQELMDRLYSRNRPQRETDDEDENNDDDNGNKESDTDVQA